MLFFDSFGWIGSILLAICGLPMLIKSYKEGHAEGVSLLFLLAWWLGEVLLLVFVIGKFKGIILILNYSANVLLVTGILYYKFRPRKVVE